MIDESEIASRIRKVLIDALSLNLEEEDLRYSEKLDELVGLDSLAVLEFVTALEKEFGITIEPEQLELEVLRDPNKLAAYIAARTGPGSEQVPRTSGVES
jgi:acyl carrier protein